jgi:hypothetical protein
MQLVCSLGLSTFSKARSSDEPLRVYTSFRTAVGSEDDLNLVGGLPTIGPTGHNVLLQACHDDEAAHARHSSDQRELSTPGGVLLTNGPAADYPKPFRIETSKPDGQVYTEYRRRTVAMGGQRLSISGSDTFALQSDHLHRFAPVRVPGGP